LDDYSKLTRKPEFNPDDVIASEVIEHTVTTNDRSLARQVALQVLYEVDSSGHKVGDVINAQLGFHQLSTRSLRYMQQLVMGVLKYRESMDAVISHFAPEFPLNQVAIVDRNILRIAMYEFAVHGEIPIKVAIDEAVELAKLFGADGAPRFVNGVLGALVQEHDTMRRILEQYRTDETDESTTE
jgi:transcription antitermination protein NusB